MTVFLVTFLFFAMVMAAMAVGVVFGRGAIKGSCGGAANGNCACATKCEKRRKREKEMEDAAC